VTLISELFCFFRAGRITPSDSAFPPSGAAVEPCGCVGSEEYYSQTRTPAVKRLFCDSHHIPGP